MKDRVDDSGGRESPRPPLRFRPGAWGRRRRPGSGCSTSRRALLFRPVRERPCGSPHRALRRRRGALRLRWGRLPSGYRRLAGAHSVRRSDGRAGPGGRVHGDRHARVRDDVVGCSASGPQSSSPKIRPANLVFAVGVSPGDREARDPSRPHRDRRALVYASTRKARARAELCATRARAPPRTTPGWRSRAHAFTGFADGSLRVVCATNAFRMVLTARTSRLSSTSRSPAPWSVLPKSAARAATAHRAERRFSGTGWTWDARVSPRARGRGRPVCPRFHSGRSGNAKRRELYLKKLRR
jgi:hypothetical protein